MLRVPHDGDTKVLTNLGAGASLTEGTSVTTGAGTSATKGTVVELISAASNTQDSWGIYVQAQNYAAAATLSEGMFDILIGGATDDVLIPNLIFGYASDGSANGLRSWFFPLHIPGGLRIAAQAAGTRLSTAFSVGVKLFGGTSPPFRVGRKVTTYGVGTVPNGVTVAPGQSGANGTFTQITSATSEDHFMLLPGVQPSGDTTVIGKVLKATIGLGAATEDVYGQWDYGLSANETVSGPYDLFPLFRDVASGTRLAMRLSIDSTNPETAYTAVIHAVS